MALLEWSAYGSQCEESDLEIADNMEAKIYREKKSVLKKFEAWLGKGIK